MNRKLLEDFYNDPALYARLAHRARARAIHQGFAWLIGYLKAQLAPQGRLRPARWIARLG